jgi:hypothetical protein
VLRPKQVNCSPDFVAGRRRKVKKFMLAHGKCFVVFRTRGKQLRDPADVEFLCLQDHFSLVKNLSEINAMSHK